MSEDRSESSKPDSKSRIDQSVPRPDPQRLLTEGQKRALELQDEAEHESGPCREELTTEATKKSPPEE